MTRWHERESRVYECVQPIPLNYETRKPPLIRLSFIVAAGVALSAALWVLAPVNAPGRGGHSRIAQAKTDLVMFCGALDTFEIDAGRYPTTAEGLNVLVQAPANAPYWRQYVNRINNDPWGNPYVYELNASGRGKITCLGADGIKGTADDLVQLSG